MKMVQEPYENTDYVTAEVSVLMFLLVPTFRLFDLVER